MLSIALAAHAWIAVAAEPETAEVPAAETGAETGAETAAPTAEAPAEAKPERRFTVLPVPTFDAAPETGPSVGAVALFSFRPFDDARTSNASLEATVTWKKQVVLATDWQVYLRDDRWLLAGSVAGMRYPERYWGVGPDTPDAAGEDYDAWRVEAAPEVLWRPWKSLFVGPSYHLAWMFHVTPAPGGLLDTSGVTGAEGSVSSGLGYAVVWDDRASTTNPPGGSHYLALRQHAFGPVLGGDTAFTRTSLDGRLYLRTWKTHVLALQAVAEVHTGDPPFRMLALLGGDTITRGYYLGRYRDRHLLAVQAEYRAPIVWRIGAVAFVGVGEVSPRLDRHALAWLAPTVGGGLRVRVEDEEGINLRLDYAWGRGAGALYFGFGETF